jgi:UDP-glucose 6-dehydrogenase
VQHVVSRIGGSFLNKNLAIFGWSFKAGTSDSQETRSAAVFQALLDSSVKEITIFDPGFDPAKIQGEVTCIKESIASESGCQDANIVVHDDPYTACEDADAILILTDWDHFGYLPLPLQRPLLADTKDVIRGDSFGSALSLSCTVSAPSPPHASLTL